MRVHKTNVGFVIFTAFTAALTVNVQAAGGSLPDALVNGQFSGDLNTVLQFGSNSDAGAAAGPMSDTKTASSALTLGYKTAPFHGFIFGTAVQLGYDWKLGDGRSWRAQGEDDERNSVRAIKLQNAYLDYTFKPDQTKTRIRIGRQNIISPLVMSSGMYPMKDAFDALVLTNRDLNATTVKLIYIENWVKRYADNHSTSILEKEARFDGSVYSIYLHNRSVKGLSIEGQYLANHSDATWVGDPPTNFFTSGPYRHSFVALNYQLPQLPVTLGTKYVRADYKNAANSELWGAKLATKIGRMGLTFAYTSTSEANNLPGTLGHVPWFRAFAFTETSPEVFAGLDETSVTLHYDTGVAGLRTSLVYAAWDQSAAGIVNSGFDLDGGSELALDLQYKFQQTEGLSTRLQLSQMDSDVAGDSDLTFVRMHLKYAF